MHGTKLKTEVKGYSIITTPWSFRMEHTAKCNIPRSPGELLVRPVVVLLSLSHSGTSGTRRGVVIVAISKQTDQQQFSFSSFLFFTFNWLSVPRHRLGLIRFSSQLHITSHRKLLTLCWSGCVFLVLIILFYYVWMRCSLTCETQQSTHGRLMCDCQKGIRCLLPCTARTQTLWPDIAAKQESKPANTTF